MIRIVSWRFLILLLPVLFLCSCSCGEADEAREKSAEELRVEASQRIDTVAVRTVINPDSIAGYESLATISADAWILVEDSLGLLISEKNADKRMFPASLTKMMTGVLTLERGNMTDTLEITPDVFLVKDCMVRLGDRYLLGHLLREMLMLSDNDAATAIAKHLEGDSLSFISLMNEKAAYLGMDSTRFANANGMPNDSNYSSARDLLTLARYAMRDTVFAQIVGTEKTNIPLLDGRRLYAQNTNLLLGKYEGYIGVKTGYTRQAGACLASAATRNGTTLFLVMLKSRSRSSRFSESEALLDYGFNVVEAYRKAKP